jgi:hypothetical protein
MIVSLEDPLTQERFKTIGWDEQLELQFRNLVKLYVDEEITLKEYLSRLDKIHSSLRS